MVMKIEVFADGFPVLTGMFKPRDDSRSVLKVFAKLRRVGGMSVSPSVLTAFWYAESTTIESTAFNETLPFELDTTNGTVGIPSHLAATSC